MAFSNEAWRWGSEVFDWLNHVSAVIGAIKVPMGILMAPLLFLYRIFFGKARKFSPAAGLASGYYNNFLRPILHVTDGPTEIFLWMSAAPDLLNERGRYEDIVLGKNPNFTEYKNCQVQTAQGPRTILLKRPAGATDLKYPALDFPRTLSGLDPNGDRVSELDRLSNLPGSGWLALGGKRALQRKELRNFWETLSNLIEKEYFGTRVKVFWGNPESARSVKEYPELFDRTNPNPNLPLRLLLRAAGF